MTTSFERLTLTDILKATTPSGLPTPVAFVFSDSRHNQESGERGNVRLWGLLEIADTLYGSPFIFRITHSAIKSPQKAR